MRAALSILAVAAAGLAAATAVRAQRDDLNPGQLGRPLFETSNQIPAGQLRQPGDAPEAWTLTPPPALYELRTEGRVESIGSDEIQLDRGASPDAVVTVTPETTFTYEGETVTPEQIPEGSEVRVTYDLEGNDRIATRVEAAPVEGELPPADAPPVVPDIPGSQDVRPLPGVPDTD